MWARNAGMREAKLESVPGYLLTLSGGNKMLMSQAETAFVTLCLDYLAKLILGHSEATHAQGSYRVLGWILRSHILGKECLSSHLLKI